MARTNIDLDESAVEAVMRRFAFTTKREAVNYALRAVASEPLDVTRALALEGSGWHLDLDELRETRA
ncbi:MAG: type II toxin-antitoxin system VapB family antitoxin [Agrococcus sp.]